MQNNVERFPMEANFEGLIQLLAKNLYPEPDVFIRELIQNAHDGITLRREVEPYFEGRIEVECDPDGLRIIVRDNGHGMDRNDIKEFLSVIGSTGTGSARKRLLTEGTDTARDLIGQFGIGMLSAFLVAKRVTVRTRKVGTAGAYQWSNDGSTECELQSAPDREAGTEVILEVDPQYQYLAEAVALREAIVKYCDFLPIAIFLNGAGPVNLIDPPWGRTSWASPRDKEQAYERFINHRYPDIPLDVIPIEIDGPFKARGVLYISDRHVPDINTAGIVDIYVRHMFVRGRDAELLPPWAKFVRGVIDTPDLQPTSGRDNVQRTTDAYKFFQKKLGELVVDRLSYLARHVPERFQQINAWHHYHLKGMATAHDDFFELVGDMLLFETNSGPLALGDYLALVAKQGPVGVQTPIHYFSRDSASQQFFRMAEARGIVVIDASAAFEKVLLEKYAARHAETVCLSPVDTAGKNALFRELDASESAPYRLLKAETDAALRSMGLDNVIAEVRGFAPVSLPAVIVATPETEAEQQLDSLLTQPWLSEVLADIARDALHKREQRHVRLVLNADSPFVQSLSGLGDYGDTVRDMLFGLYCSAVIYSPTFLTPRYTAAVHRHLVRLIERLSIAEGADVVDAASKRQQITHH